MLRFLSIVLFLVGSILAAVWAFQGYTTEPLSIAMLLIDFSIVIISIIRFLDAHDYGRNWEEPLLFVLISITGMIVTLVYWPIPDTTFHY